ncbi:hypothetical protein [Pseudaestuariivita atlantica]|uniref:hypothetical protein n=1 Tax=Pseudaestuariivita atlantica TaxID=1317121 RepID=UPI00106AB31E|nr:hypothetical protein [Pseudaestuariivita atlantica]
MNLVKLMSEIQSISDLEIWLEDQSPQVSQALAARCALRTFPVVVKYGYMPTGKFDSGQNLLNFIRNTLVPVAASLSPRNKKTLSIFFASNFAL